MKESISKQYEKKMRKSIFMKKYFFRVYGTVLSSKIHDALKGFLFLLYELPER